MAEQESKSDTTLLQVGEIIKPMVSEDSVKAIIREDYGFEVIKMKELNSYDDQNFYVTVKSTHNNPHIETLHPHGYVLKILNTMDSQRQPYIEAMQALIIHIGEQGIATAQPVPSITGKLMTLKHIAANSPEAEGNDSCAKTKAHVVRLFTFVPGRILFEVTYTPRLCYSVGKFAGKLDRKLQTFHHPFYDTHSSIWSLGSLPKLRDFVYAVPIDSDQEMVNDILTRFENEVIPMYSTFQKGMIHGDYNEQNILVSLKTQTQEQHNIENEEYEVCGVIDFGDATDSYLVFEVAIAMCYIMIESKAVHAFDAAGHLLAGYVSEVLLNETEMKALKICIAGRFCHSLVLGAYNLSLDPNNDYVVTTSKRGWPCLRELWNTPSQELMSRWNNIISTYTKTSV